MSLRRPGSRTLGGTSFPRAAERVLGTEMPARVVIPVAPRELLRAAGRSRHAPAIVHLSLAGCSDDIRQAGPPEADSLERPFAVRRPILSAEGQVVFVLDRTLVSTRALCCSLTDIVIVSIAGD
jgi:hypothetical protein